MTQVEIPLNQWTTRVLLIAFAAGYVCLTYYFVRWDFAHAVALRADSVEVAEILNEMSPSDPQAQFTLAAFRDRTFNADDASAALDHYAAAAGLAPYDYRYWLDYGRARERAGDPDGAGRTLAYALDRAPHYADVLWALGNVRVRQGNITAGLRSMAAAARAKPAYLRPAIVTAMQFLDGDRRRVSEAFDNDDRFKAEIALYLADVGKDVEAFDTWNEIPPARRGVDFREAGERLQSKLFEAKQVRLAASVAGDLTTTNAPAVGAVYDGGFELPLRFKDNAVFYWQIGDGGVPQVGLSNTQKHGGGFSLYLIFDTMLAADMRQISQTAAVDPQTEYVFEFFSRSELQGSVAWEVVSVVDGQVIARAQIKPSGDWVRSEAVFATSPGTDGVTIRLVRDGCVSSVCPISGKLWIDDVAIKLR